MKKHLDRIDAVREPTACWRVSVTMEWRGSYHADGIAKEIGRDIHGTISHAFNEFMQKNGAVLTAVIVKT